MGMVRRSSVLAIDPRNTTQSTLEHVKQQYGDQIRLLEETLQDKKDTIKLQSKIIELHGADIAAIHVSHNSIFSVMVTN